jgi:hypothetical protein
MRLFASSKSRHRIVGRLFSLTSNSLTVLDVADITGFLPAQLYPTLASLEREGRLISWWAAGNPPRLRLYAAALQS